MKTAPEEIPDSSCIQGPYESEGQTSACLRDHSRHFSLRWGTAIGSRGSR